jgi:acetylornithine deacetylase
MERYREVKRPEFFLANFPSPLFPLLSNPLKAVEMANIFELTRAMVDIESTTNEEEGVGLYLLDLLADLAGRTCGHVERCDVAPRRFNIFATWGEPTVTLSTHMDTVPPFFPSREDADFIWGRGAADAKGIIAAMIKSVEGLLDAGVRNFALLFVVGEERNSAGAYAAARDSRGSRFLINGEPTDNKLALASKGMLRFELEAHGRLAHSAYPELGESAIDKLLDVLADLRRMPMPIDPVLGQSTLNIGVISGGRAPNVISDAARAEIAIRLVEDPAPLRQAVHSAAAGRVTAREVLFTPAIRFEPLAGFETKVVAFTTDIPSFDNAWGRPYLIGPGSIHLAHTSEERVPKRELLEAAQIYQKMVKQLLAAG